MFSANKKLSDMTAELSKAQEHARRFQELLKVERRKQMSLKVHVRISLNCKQDILVHAHEPYAEELKERVKIHTCILHVHFAYLHANDLELPYVRCMCCVHCTYNVHCTCTHVGNEYVKYMYMYVNVSCGCLQHALEQELGKKEAGTGAGLSVAAQKAFVDTLSESLSPHSKSHGPARVDDVIRKNEVSYYNTCTCTLYVHV